MEHRDKGKEKEDQMDLRNFLPTSFGAQKKGVNVSKRYEATRRSATVKVVKKRKRELTEEEVEEEKRKQLSIADATKAIQEGGGPVSSGGFVIVPDQKPIQRVVVEEEEVEEAVDEGEGYESIFPISNEIVLRGHTRGITALALDKSGSRLLSGSNDYHIKFWDFAGMDSTHRSFRSIEPVPGHLIRALQFSISGDQFLTCTGSAKPKIFNRDGFEVCEFTKGDMYIADMAHTKGHVSGVTHGEWHPTDKNIVITSSSDSTVRIWDVTHPSQQKNVLKFKDAKGKPKLPVTTCAFSKDGSLIAAAGEDGSIWLWGTTGPFNRPKQVLRNVHSAGMDISRLSFAADGYTLISRAGDDTLKVWDIRQFKEPLKAFTDLPSFGFADCTFSPNDDFIVTGTSAKKDEGSGLLVFYSKATLEKVRQIGVAAGSVTQILWHPKINQLIVGCSENVHVLFDPEISTNGALLSTSRAKRKKDPMDAIDLHPVHNPHALPMFKPAPSTKRQKIKDRKDPLKSRKPDLPMSGPGFGGKIGSSLTHHLMKGLLKKTDRVEDPREAILKYAKEAEEDPYWFRAYKHTQPKTEFDYKALEDEQKEEERRLKEAEKKAQQQQSRNV